MFLQSIKRVIFMEKLNLWKEFEKTGKIEDYLKFINQKNRS